MAMVVATEAMVLGKAVEMDTVKIIMRVVATE